MLYLGIIREIKNGNQLKVDFCMENTTLITINITTNKNELYSIGDLVELNFDKSQYNIIKKIASLDEESIELILNEDEIHKIKKLLEAEINVSIQEKNILVSYDVINSSYLNIQKELFLRQDLIRKLNVFLNKQLKKIDDKQTFEIIKYVINNFVNKSKEQAISLNEWLSFYSLYRFIEKTYFENEFVTILRMALIQSKINNPNDQFGEDYDLIKKLKITNYKM